MKLRLLELLALAPESGQPVCKGMSWRGRVLE